MGKVRQKSQGLNSVALATEHAEIAMRRRDWREALIRWQAVLEHFGDRVPASAYVQMGRAHCNLGNFEAAETTIKEGRTKHHNNADLAIEYAKIAMRRRDWPAAAARWQAVADEFGDASPPGVFMKLSRAHRSLGNFDVAERALQRGRTIKPDSAELAAEHAEIAVARKDWPEAVARLEVALRACGDRKRARFYVLLSRAHRFQGNFELAEGAIAEGLASEPGSISVAVEHAEIASARKDWPEAVTRWQAILDGGPDQPLRRTRALFWWLSTGQLSRAGNAALPYYRYYRAIVPATIRAWIPSRIRTVVGRAHHLKVGRESSRGRIRTIKRIHSPDRNSVTVVIPVYNSLPETLQCVSSVVSNRTFPYDVLVMDDCSDSVTSVTLRSVCQNHHFMCYEKNKKNIGYTRTVNRAINLINSGELILLNSDTIVTSGWAEKLTAAAYSMPSVATVTPLSNAAGAFSIPENNKENKLLSGLTPEDYNNALESVTERLRPQVPTGNGFCLYITRQALNELRGFDQINFPRGYGEENDFSMRAKKAGFVNLIDDATFVYHRKSASFGAERAVLAEEGGRHLKKLHPSYRDEVQRWLKEDPLDPLRRRFSEALMKRNWLHQQRNRISVLYILHDGEGGVRHTADDLARQIALQASSHILRCGVDCWELWAWNCQRGRELLKVYRFRTRWSPFAKPDSERLAALESIYNHCSPDVIHIRHFIGIWPELVAHLRASPATVIVSLHDMYSVCPTIHLQDERGDYCGGTCTEGPGPCPAAAKWFGKTLRDLKHNRVFEHRARMSNGLLEADCLVTTSLAAKALILDKLPDLKKANFKIIEHGRRLSREKLRGELTHNGPIPIISFGALGASKGARLFEYLLCRNKESGNPFEFHFVGRGLGESTVLQDLGGVLHGSYLREDIGKRMACIRPYLTLLLSTVPETYCHTLTEAWAMGLPVIASDIGALGERVRRHGGGWLVDFRNPEECWSTLRRIASNEHEYKAVAEQVDNIRIREEEEMAKDYMDLYISALAAGQERTDGSLCMTAAEIK